MTPARKYTRKVYQHRDVKVDEKTVVYTCSDGEVIYGTLNKDSDDRFKAALALILIEELAGKLILAEFVGAVTRQLEEFLHDTDHPGGPDLMDVVEPALLDDVDGDLEEQEMICDRIAAEEAKAAAEEGAD